MPVGLTVEYRKTNVSSSAVGLLQANTSINSNDNPPQSILLNVCGRLLLLQQERDGSSLVSQQKSKKNAVQSVTFLPPVMIAAHVESIWTISRRNSTNPYFSNALWLCCGLHGMKVWLPLYRKLDEPRFQSHRIMLTFNLTIYPLGESKHCSLLVTLSPLPFSGDGRRGGHSRRDVRIRTLQFSNLLLNYENCKFARNRTRRLTTNAFRLKSFSIMSFKN